MSISGHRLDVIVETAGGFVNEQQAQHQSLDAGFVGLIISCFNRDQVLRCTAFQTRMANAPQSNGVGLHHMEIDRNDDDDVKQAILRSLKGMSSD